MFVVIRSILCERTRLDISNTPSTSMRSRYRSRCFLSTLIEQLAHKAIIALQNNNKRIFYSSSLLPNKKHRRNNIQQRQQNRRPISYNPFFPFFMNTTQKRNQKKSKVQHSKKNTHSNTHTELSNSNSNEYYFKVLQGNKKSRFFLERDERREEKGLRDCSGSVSRDARTGRR